MMMNQIPSLEDVREFVIAGHGNLEKIQLMYSKQPKLLLLSYEWKPNDTETALQAAAHVGSRVVAEYLLAQGALLDICTAAMLGRKEDVDHFLQQNPSSIHITGAHGIPLMTHAVFSGDVELTEWLFHLGARAGMSQALCIVVDRSDINMTRWLLENGEPDLDWKNFQDKTADEIAIEKRGIEITKLLNDYRNKQ